jgi:hypothetical protein
LVDFVTSGKTLDLAGEESVNESVMRSWSETRTVQADMIREILLGRLAAPPDPHGLRLRGARIGGCLDLENITTTVGLELYDCFLPDGVVARDASLAFLTFEGCLLEHPSGPPIAADRLRVASLVSLSRSTVIASAEDGAVRLAGAHIGYLYCPGTKIRNESGGALLADTVQVDQDVFLNDGFEAVGAGDSGAVSLTGARIGGQMYCSGAKIRNESGVALSADNMHIDQGMFLNPGFEAVGAGDNAAVRLTGTHIAGQLEFSPTGVKNGSRPQAQLELDGLTYGRIPTGLSLKKWLSLLRNGTPSYADQPYQQLAAVYRAAGRDASVARIA